MWLVEYDLKPGYVFPGFGGYPGKNGKFIGLTSAEDLSSFRIITPSSEYTFDDIFPLLFAYYLSFNQTPVWNEDGSVTIPETPDLEFLKKVKLNELKNYVAGFLSETDWVIIKLYSMQDEGFDTSVIAQEKAKYTSVLAKRRSIRDWNANMENAIKNATSVEELLNLKIEFD